MFALNARELPLLGSLQPNRFAPVGYLLLIGMPAAIGFLAHDRVGVGERREGEGAASVAYLSWIDFPAGSLRRERDAKRGFLLPNTGHFGARPPEVRGMGEYSKWLLDGSGCETTDSARILFETSKARIHDGGHMAGYYAYATQREFIGGPYPFMHFAGFWDATLFNRPIVTFISHKDFIKYLDLYNIGWIVAHSEESKRYLKNIAGVVPLEGFKELQTYKIERVHSYFLYGKGRILERGHNRLVLGELSGDKVVLKYHYVPGLVSQPAAQIAPVTIAGDPQPFIMISNPPKGLRLSLP